jgi:hypothetical protein
MLLREPRHCLERRVRVMERQRNVREKCDKSPFLLMNRFDHWLFGHDYWVMLSTLDVVWLYVDCKRPWCVQLYCLPSFGFSTAPRRCLGRRVRTMERGRKVRGVFLTACFCLCLLNRLYDMMCAVTRQTCAVCSVSVVCYFGSWNACAEFRGHTLPHVGLLRAGG